MQFLLQYHAFDHIFAKNGKYSDLVSFTFLQNGGRGHWFRIALEISSSMAISGWVIDQIRQHHIFQLRTLPWPPRNNNRTKQHQYRLKPTRPQNFVSWTQDRGNAILGELPACKRYKVKIMPSNYMQEETPLKTLETLTNWLRYKSYNHNPHKHNQRNLQWI